MWKCSSRDQNYLKMIVQNKSTPDISGLNGIFCCPPLLSINALLQAIYLGAPLLPTTSCFCSPSIEENKYLWWLLVSKFSKLLGRPRPQ